MNYLAHLFLSNHSGESLIGNLLGDFVKGRINGQYNSHITRGIILHRKIDSYTDLHVKKLCQRRLVSSNRRRFAGIIIDVSYDHFLSKHWAKFTQMDFDDFIADVYSVLQENKSILPEKLQHILPYMVRENWLASYQDIAGVEIALNRISTRLKRKNALLGSVDELENNYNLLEDQFLGFFPDLIRFTETCSQNIKDNPHRRLNSN